MPPPPPGWGQPEQPAPAWGAPQPPQPPQQPAWGGTPAPQPAWGTQPPGPAGYQAYDSRVTWSYAGIGARWLANLIDGFVTALIPAILGVIGVFTIPTTIGTCTESTFDGSRTYPCEVPETGPLLAVIAGAVVVYLLAVWFVIIRPMARTGQPIGAKALGIKVVDQSTGQPIGTGRSVGRFLAASFLSGWFCSLGYIWALFHDRKQTWHDMLASSVVVNA